MSDVPASSGDPKSDMDGREALVENSLDQLFAVHDRAIEDGVADPVLFLIDCEDSIGSPIARGWEGDDTVNAAILSNADRKDDAETTLTTTLARAFSFADSRHEVPELFPYLAESFQQAPPADQLLVVAITFGGAGTFTVPLAARPA